MVQHEHTRAYVQYSIQSSEMSLLVFMRSVIIIKDRWPMRAKVEGGKIFDNDPQR